MRRFSSGGGGGDGESVLLLCRCAAYLLQELAFAAYVSLFKQLLMVFSASSALSVSVSSHRSVSFTSVVCKRRCKFSLVPFFFALRPFAGPQFQIGYKKATNTIFFMWLYFSCY